MISVDQALEYVKNGALPLHSRRLSLSEVLRLRLRESIVSPIDSPPFDKVLLDGYAVIASDQSTERTVLEQVTAGAVPHHAVEPGTTINVMTGAPLPDGANAIIKVEDIVGEVETKDATTIEVPKSGVAAGTGILERGAAFHVGQEVLEFGRCLSPIDIALLAEVGRAEVTVTPRPRVAVLATGNELVECGQPVEPGHICNSNGPMLMAMLRACRAEPVDLGISRDEPVELMKLMEQGLQADILLVTGGVSAGVMDLVPGVLQGLGVKEVFHKVRMKPGKPLWFGEYEHQDRRTLVYGMPGNPVSTLVSFELFVKPALQVLAGDDFHPPQSQPAVLTNAIGHHGKRPTYYPSRLSFGERASGRPTVETLPWRGSADLAALTAANALTLLPSGDYQYDAGTEVEVIPLLPFPSL
ncbi:MAG: gephyrin-like molybdotransferase Glp [Planctomycetota bacterium]